MHRKPTYEELGKRVEELERGALEPVRGERSLGKDDQCRDLWVDRLTAQPSQTNALLEREIAERMRVEEALRASEVRLKIILDAIHTGIIVVDAKSHTIIGINAACERMFGAPREQILGRVCHGNICPAKEGQCPCTDLGDTLENAEQVLLTAGGRAIPIFKTVVSVMLSGREHLLESFIDATELKPVEEERQQSERLAYQLEKRVDMLNFGNDVALKVMHELRNPLVAIGGFSRLIYSRDCPEDKLKEYTKIIFEQSIRLDNAVNQVLAHLKAAGDSL